MGTQSADNSYNSARTNSDISELHISTNASFSKVKRSIINKPGQKFSTKTGPSSVPIPRSKYV